MTLKEAAKFREAERKKKLRAPECNNWLTEAQQKEMEIFAYAVYCLFTHIPQIELETSGLVRKSWIRRVLDKFKKKVNPKDLKKSTECAVRKLSFVKSLERLEDKNGYKISTDFGDGVFFLDKEIFINNEYPPFIKKNHCFGNCIHFCSIEENRDNDVKILNGISGAVAWPICHSVISIREDYIIDFNLGIVMTKELYLKLCRFEVLSEVGAEVVQDNIDFLRENADLANKYGTFPSAWCMLEFVEYIKKLRNNEVDEIDSRYMY